MKFFNHDPGASQGPDAAARLGKLPPYLFAEIDKKKRELQAHGKDVIDLGVGDPDLPTPKFIIDALAEAAQDPVNHRYALDAGMPELRQTIARWFERRYQVKLDPEKEILPLIGSKEGIAHFPLAILNTGDVSLVPDPCYPPYRSGTWFAGGEVHSMPLLESNDYLPDLAQIPAALLRRAKLLYLNYPNNPTAATATPDFFAQALDFAVKNRLVVLHDAAYNEVTYDGYRAPSFLQTPGAKEHCVEFHSLSKTYHMTGWRVGFAVGSAQWISLLGKVKSNIDSGIFRAVQWAAKAALEKGEEALKEHLGIYRARRDLLIGALNGLGWKIEPPKATFYCWIPVPAGYTSAELALRFLEDLYIVVTPGSGFGANGEGYFRISLTVPDHDLKRAVERIEKSRGGIRSRS